MERRYRLIVSGRDLYKEVLLTNTLTSVCVGTTNECEIRMPKNSFFEEFTLSFSRIEDTWSVCCSDNVYISEGNNQKTIVKKLGHGDDLEIFYRRYDQKFLSITVVFDFETVGEAYCYEIAIPTGTPFYIGSAPDCQIQLSGGGIREERMEAYLSDGVLSLRVCQSEYGILKNGSHTTGTVRIQDTDFFSCAQYSFYFRNARLYVTDANVIRLHGLSHRRISASGSALTYPKFNRSTRIQTVIPTAPIAVLDPPEKPQKPKQNLLMTILPSLGMILVIVMLSIFSGRSMGMMILFSGCSMAIGMITAVYNYRSNEKEYAEGCANRIETYHAYIQEKRTEIAQARAQEAEMLKNAYPTPEENCRNIMDFSGSLFDRAISDQDFLTIRLGTGTIPSLRQVTYSQKERICIDDEMLLIPAAVQEEFRMLADVPVTVDLKKAHNLGIVGGQAEKYAFFKNTLVDLSTRQYYRDLKIFAFFNEQNAGRASLIRFLPHLQNEELHMRNVICDDASKVMQLEYLYKELSVREAVCARNKDTVFPAIVILVYDDIGLQTHPLARYISSAWKYQVYFLFFAVKKEFLPTDCGCLISLEPGGSGILAEAANGHNTVRFSFGELPDPVLRQAVEKLAPVYCEDVSLESALTKNISLFSLLGIISADDLDLGSRWASSDICRSMAAPLGVKVKNEVVSLDLHEAYHGPHGLVAGTTGSGKSEILQSYILSMATLYHPYEVGFVIIDFKGGGMANQFRDLPHLIGAITDIDGKEINRSLLSIRAELDKRKRLFSQAGVNSIAAYITKYKRGEVQEPLPHLIIIVDEFAELKMEQPEFMKELVSAARIGRSLGVHLILATQKPAGVIDEQIWSNSKFKLCLRVQNKEDSNEVLKSPLAAEIREPGRAYLQVGNNEIFELFQSAYSGASAHSEVVGTAIPFQLCHVETSGRRTVLYEKKAGTRVEDRQTQLQALVSHIGQYCAGNGIVRLPPISLPPLASCLVYNAKQDSRKDARSILAPLGIMDDPARQRQEVCYLDLTANNTFILGSAQYGKTNILQLLIHSVAAKYTSDEVNFYVLDFSSMIFKNLEALKHVGGVVLTNEDEKMKNFIKLMLGEMSRRKQLLASHGLTSFASYRESGHDDLPQIILLIDNYVPMKELYADYEDAFLAICRDGLSLGISTVIANSQSTGVSYKIMSNFAQRVCLFCNDSGEYSAVFEHCRMRPNNTIGRGLIRIDKEIFEFQSYLSFPGEREIDRVAQMRRFVEQTNASNSGRPARAIPEIPGILTGQYMQQYTPASADGYQMAIGLDYEHVAPVYLNLREQTVVAISGRKGGGKRNFLRLVFRQLMANLFTSESQVYLVDHFSRQLKEFSMLGIVQEYTVDSSKLAAFVEDIHAELEDRFARWCGDGPEAIEDAPMLVLVIANADAVLALSQNTAVMKKYKEIIGKYAGMKVSVIFSDLSNTAIGFSSPEILKLIKESRDLYFFDDLKNLKLVELSGPVLRAYKKEVEAGVCYHITNDGVEKIKTILAES